MQLRINWNKNVSASGYIIEQYKNGSWVRIARIEGNSTVTYRIAGLQSGTSYKFRIQAFGFDGTHRFTVIRLLLQEQQIQQQEQQIQQQ